MTHSSYYTDRKVLKSLIIFVNLFYLSFSFYQFFLPEFVQRENILPVFLLYSNTLFTTYRILRFWYFWPPNVCVYGGRVPHQAILRHLAGCPSHKCRLLFSHYFLIARKTLLFLAEKICWKISFSFCLSEKSIYSIFIFEGYFCWV